ncbi:MAG: ATP-binding protein [Bacteroidales bacterium]|nr:ATP-binding protein [Candidatus Scybalocola fimicaballi]
MERTCINQLIEWKNSPRRKPLIIEGARQVGKTWLVKEFGKSHYQNCIYVNFEQEKSLQNIFEKDLNPQRIIETLQLYTNKVIKPEDSLIFFDEIQAAPSGITSLKYFYENASQYHIIAAGSLLGMSVHTGESFPVGKVNFLQMHPMSFIEFLNAIGKDQFANALIEQKWSILSPFHEELCQILKSYLIVGGMPEVVNEYAEKRDYKVVQEIQREILDSYERDFSKHAPINELPRIRQVWESVPTQLAKENKKFIYGLLREGARAKDYELAINWICDAGLLLKTNRVTKPELPLSHYSEPDIFKLYMLDVGLLSTLSNIRPEIILEGNRIFTEYKGALTEQFVHQQMTQKKYEGVYYWTNDRSTAEVDFVIQNGNMIIPIEVKAETNVHAKSFKLFCEKYNPTSAIRTSMLPYKDESWMTNIPLYGMI